MSQYRPNCSDRSMGLVPRDAAQSNLKVNGVMSACAVEAESLGPNVWAQLNNNRTGFQLTSASGLGEFVNINAVANADVFPLVTGYPLVEVSGTHAGTVTFLVSGTFKLSLYVEANQTNEESLSECNLRTIFSNAAPTNSSPIQVVIPLSQTISTTNSSSLEIITEVDAGDIYSLYAGTSTQSVQLNYSQILLTITRV